MSETLVIGHRNPDTDSICSAIAYAEYKNLVGRDRVISARCGDTNERIDYVLRRFGFAPPRFVADVAPKIRDVMQQQIVSIEPDATAADAMKTMEESHVRVLPIIDKERFCRGLVSVFKMSRFFMPGANRLVGSRRVISSIRTLARTLNARTLFGIRGEEEEDLILMIGAMARESFASRLVNYPHEKVLVIVGDRREIQELAIRQRVRCVVVTGDLRVEDDIVELAKAHEVCLLISPLDSTSTAMVCRAAIGVDHLKHDHFLSFREDESIAGIRDVVVASQFQTFPVVDAYKRVVGILSKTDLLKPVDRRLILVDHNELSQAVRGAEQVKIMEIIDHHRIRTLSTQEPILFVNQPVGSTCTIVSEFFFRDGIEPSPEVAGLLLAGIVSDTLNLTSPTATKVDAEVLARLESIAGVEAKGFTEEFFSAGSLLLNRSADDAITTDCKEYREADSLFSVAQIEEIGFEHFWNRKDRLKSALEHYRLEGGYLFSGLLITDVVRQTSLLLFVGPEDLASKIRYARLERGIYELQGVVSRKKQLLPYLIRCLENRRSLARL